MRAVATAIAREAFERRINETPGEGVLVSDPEDPGEKAITNLHKVWAGCSSGPACRILPFTRLRHTFAVRLSAVGVADHMATQMRSQGDADVFKLYSRAKLDRKANDRRTLSRG